MNLWSNLDFIILNPLRHLTALCKSAAPINWNFRGTPVKRIRIAIEGISPGSSAPRSLLTRVSVCPEAGFSFRCRVFYRVGYSFEIRGDRNRK